MDRTFLKVNPGSLLSSLEYISDAMYVNQFSDIIIFSTFEKVNSFQIISTKIQLKNAKH